MGINGYLYLLCVHIGRPGSPWLLSANLSSEPRSVEVVWLADFDHRIRKFSVYAKPVVEGNCRYWFTSKHFFLKVSVLYGTVIEQFVNCVGLNF